MKRIIAILTIFLMIPFSACTDKEQDAVTLTVLAEGGGSVSYEREFVSRLQELVDFAYPEDQILIEAVFLKKDAIERPTQLAQIRTEIMAGKGPDIFILPTWDVKNGYYKGEMVPEEEPLFKEVESAMNNGVFLPLDEYIAKSNHLKLEEHIDIVMDAGRTVEGQVVLPMYFSYYLAPLESEKVDEIIREIDSFDELVNSDDEQLFSSLGYAPDWTSYAFSALYDSKKEKLVVSQQELADTLRNIVKVGECESPDSIRYEIQWPKFDDIYLYSINSADDNAYYFVLPNTTGGVTAHITAYTAINRNCQNPDAAFKVIELFFGKEMQTTGKIYSEENGKFYTYLDLTQFGASDGIKTSKANYSEEVLYNIWEDVQDVHSRINHVSFASEMDCMLHDQWVTSFYEVIYSEMEEQIDFETISEELYSDWKMMVAE